MKKIILVFVMIVVVGFTFTSCKNDKKEEPKTEEVKVEENKKLASNEVYQCEMNCEKGKSYTEAGKCPVCNMDLKVKKVNMNGDSDMKKDSTKHDDGHDH